ncbi:aminoglycoside adenylyltransferase domain-containing protein, partial [Escherichia coli]|uniref:aminoglycoside adenylyltransferase domain-containing protein n=1 Tax=Escherichia coli TaxID=562 RepID=UPI0033057D7C
PAYGPQNDVTLKMPAFEWVHVQLHQQKGMISLSPPTICNSALALARIWYSASTGLIAPKDVAAAWVSERLPAEHRPLICKARAAYLGSEDDDLAMRVEETAAFVRYAKATIERILR